MDQILPQRDGAVLRLYVVLSRLDPLLELQELPEAVFFSISFQKLAYSVTLPHGNGVDSSRFLVEDRLRKRLLSCFPGRKTESTTPSFLGGNQILDWRDLPIYVSFLPQHELLRLVFTALGG